VHGLQCKFVDANACVIFSGTNRYFRKVANRMNIETTFIDATDLELVRASMKHNTKVRLNRSPLLAAEKSGLLGV